MKTTLALIMLVTPVAAQSVRPLQHTNGTIVAPTNFWTANAPAARAGLGLTATWLTNTNVVNFLTDIGLVGSGFASFNSGSQGNDASGEYASTVGGALNTASGNYSFAAGRKAKATNQGAFVWADSQTGDFFSSSSNTFNIRASGGMSLDLGTNGISFRNPEAAAATRTNLGLGASWLTNTSSHVTTNAANLTAGILPDARIDTNIARLTNLPSWATTSEAVTAQLALFTNGFYPPTSGHPNPLVGGGSLYLIGAAGSTRLKYRLIGISPAERTVLSREDFYVSVPASPTSSGNAGDIAYTNNFLYICISNNSWRRVQLGTW